MLDRFNRNELSNAIEVLVELLDVWDGDPDLEEDDPSGQCDEDGINTDLTAQWSTGAGCIISDDDFEHDGQEPDSGGYCGHYGEDQSKGPLSPAGDNWLVL
ncbi:hypothetical protein ACWPM1_07600 [Tsuneonella sp. HG249]